MKVERSKPQNLVVLMLSIYGTVLILSVDFLPLPVDYILTATIYKVPHVALGFIHIESL